MMHGKIWSAAGPAALIWLLLLGALAVPACQSESYEPLEFSELNYPFAVKNITLESGIRLAYAEEGEGRGTLLFVHGLASYLPAWQKNIPELRGLARCIAVDLPGYGKSDKGDYPYTMSFFAETLREFMDGLGIDSAVVVGHSMGGQIAMTLALQNPERVAGLVLVAPAGFEPFSETEKQLIRPFVTPDQIRDSTPQQIRENFARSFYRMPPEAGFMVEDRLRLRGARDFPAYCRAVAQSVYGMLEQPVLDRLAEITQPTLIIFGENDGLIPNPYIHAGMSTAGIARAGHQRIPGSQLRLLPECGHFVQFEHPGEVNAAIAALVREVFPETVRPALHSGDIPGNP